jgi:hypothetical protein
MKLQNYRDYSGIGVAGLRKDTKTIRKGLLFRIIFVGFLTSLYQLQTLNSIE